MKYNIALTAPERCNWLELRFGFLYIVTDTTVKTFDVQVRKLRECVLCCVVTCIVVVCSVSCSVVCRLSCLVWRCSLLCECGEEQVLLKVDVFKVLIVH